MNTDFPPDPMDMHRCRKIAEARMGPGREFWLGELTEKIPGHEVETHCLHITTPYKKVVFGIILEDLLVYAVFAHIVHGKPVNPNWLDSMANNYKMWARLNFES